MTKEVRMTKARTVNETAASMTLLLFGLRHYFDIRLPRRSLAQAGHWCFVI
jgi:hypothetical protein